MKARLSIVAGLVVGVAVAALALGGILVSRPRSAAACDAEPADRDRDPEPVGHGLTLRRAPPRARRPAARRVRSTSVEPAPALVVPQVGGGTIDLANLRGMPVWINFMATWCPSCQDEFPLMNGFAARYADTGLVVIAIDVREEEGAVAAFGESLNATFPLGLDGDGKAADTWDAIALPVHFWIDAEGIVRDGALGGIGPDVMAAGLETILPGVDVTP